MEEETRQETNERLSKTWADLRRIWNQVPKGMRVLMAAVIVLAAGGGSALLVLERTDERVLFSSLEPDDAASIVDHLKSKNVQYRLGAEGRTIYVPSEQVDDLRLELAGEGLPSGSGVGFELFDEQRFGMTEFEEQIALRRALEGELARTISRLRAVKSARVHLVMPKKSLIGSRSTPAQGSVVLELSSGRAIGGEITDAIVHLVSSSVGGLSPDKVTLVDTRGRLLSSEMGAGPSTAGLEYKGKYEKNLEGRLGDMLNQILGPGASVVQVAATFDFTEQESTEERYDPERTVLRSEQRETETTGGRVAGAGGTPGSRANLPGGAPPANPTTTSNTKREKETRNYEVDKVIKRIVNPSGKLAKLSVAVLVDGINKPEDPFEPRTAEELKKIEMAVKGGIGFDANRGDRVEVQSVPFHIPEEIEVPEISGPPVWKEWLPIGIGAIVAIVVAMFLLSLRKAVSAPPVQVEALPLPSRVQELETLIQQPNALSAPSAGAPEAQSMAPLLGEVRQMFMNDSEDAAKVIKSWLQESQQSNQETGKAKQ